MKTIRFLVLCGMLVFLPVSAALGADVGSAVVSELEKLAEDFLEAMEDAVQEGSASSGGFRPGDNDASVGSFQPRQVTKLPTTAAVARNLSGGSWVVLRGHIVRRADSPFYTLHYYIFRDGSGEITLDIGDGKWEGVTVTPDDRVEISGRVHIGFRGLRIEVERVEKLDAEKKGDEGESGEELSPVAIETASAMPDGSWVLLRGVLERYYGREGEVYALKDGTGGLFLLLDGRADDVGKTIFVWGRVFAVPDKGISYVRVEHLQKTDDTGKADEEMVI